MSLFFCLAFAGLFYFYRGVAAAGVVHYTVYRLLRSSDMKREYVTATREQTLEVKNKNIPDVTKQGKGTVIVKR